MKCNFTLFAALVLMPLAALQAHSESGSSPVPAQGALSSHDIVVYGDSSGAVIAAIAAKREGRSVI